MSRRWFSLGPNRYLCTVLDEMRKCNETKNYSPLLSLIEEAQILGNRMEAGLNDLQDIERARDERKRLEKEIKELEEKKEALDEAQKKGA